MSDSYNDGLLGMPPGPNTNWGDYQTGKSIRDNNQRIMAENNKPYDSGLLLGGGGGAPSWGAPLPAPAPINFGGGTPVSYGGTWSGGSVSSGRPGLIAAIFLAPVFLIALPLWAMLYPLSAIATGASVLAGAGLVHRAAPSLAPPQLLGATFAIGVIALVLCSRVEQQLARVAIYRWLRYALRTVTFAWLVIAMMVPVPGIRGFMMAPRLAPQLLRDPASLAIVVGCVLALHWISRLQGARQSWHGLLATLRLRSAD